MERIPRVYTKCFFDSTFPLSSFVHILIIFILFFIVFFFPGQQFASISITEQPADLVFLNTMEGSITCKGTGLPQPNIVWINEAGGLVTDVPRLRTVYPDRIVFHHFDAARYDARVHDIKYRCKVASLAGEIVSRLATVRAGKQNEIIL